MDSPKKMTRKEAFEVLELKPGSNKYDVERRYTLLAKRYRGRSDEETLNKLADITMAYDILTGRYVEPPPPDPRDDEIVLGKKRKDWKNIWAYGKVPFFVTLIVLFFVGWLVYTIVTNTPPDFQTSVFGDFIQGNDSMSGEPVKMESLIEEQNPELEKPVFSFNIISQRPGMDPQLVMGSQMKLTLMMTGAEQVDLLVLDRDIYDSIVDEGILVPLDDVCAKLQKEYPELFDGYVEPLKGKLSPDVLPEGEVAEEHIYGLDLSEKQMLNSLDLFGRNQILALCFHRPHPEKSEEVLYKLLASAESWYDPDVPVITDQAAGETTQPASEEEGEAEGSQAPESDQEAEDQAGQTKAKKAA